MDDKKKPHPPRRTKVQQRHRKRRWDDTLLPEMTLRGHWLREAGFPYGTEAEIEVREGELIIKKKKEGNGDQ